MSRDRWPLKTLSEVAEGCGLSVPDLQQLIKRLAADRALLNSFNIAVGRSYTTGRVVNEQLVSPEAVTVETESGPQMAMKKLDDGSKVPDYGEQDVIFVNR